MATKKKASTTTTPAAPAESKQQKFVRLANQRVPNAVKRILHVGNLGGIGYESTEDQRKKVIEALQEAINTTANKLNGTKVAQTPFVL